MILFLLEADKLWPSIEFKDEQSKKDAIAHVLAEFQSEGREQISGGTVKIGRFSAGRVVDARLTDDGLGILGAIEWSERVNARWVPSYQEEEANGS